MLIGGIVLVGGATLVLKQKMSARDAAHAEADRPRVVLRNALAKADQAVVDGKLERAQAALVEAAAALKQALADQPDAGLRRAEVRVPRRQGHIAAKLGDKEAAGRFLERADEAARRNLSRAPSDNIARSDRLAVALERVDHLGKTAQSRSVAERAAQHLEDSAAGASLSAPVQSNLASLWLRAAEAGPAETAAALLEQAVSRAESAARLAESPAEGLGRLSALLGRATARALEAKDTRLAIRFDRRAIEVLALRFELKADPSLERAQAALSLRLADQLPEAEALSLVEQAVALRRKSKAPAGLIAFALNDLGALHSRAKRDEAAEKAYREAVEVSEGVEGPSLRTRLIALGNHAQVLGRLDRMKAAKARAAEAYTLAESMLDATPRSRLDMVAAGLRHARLLRARPGAKRKTARAVVKKELARVATLKSARAGRMRKGLEALAKELR